ncbi:sensor histidine kinase [Tumebacillus sp. ITR2]|uniref:histidine kinase n=1 Tax=Tumebacillus amylolyticus TaxID=2801339 RepID=A0ABS1J5X9_9BACL|nr:ATP-binding protein [Tumebacillus amylolyticus]MBL0385676.1 sensor histidine kinase [Tumebacillus amylolyticus]
MQNKRFQLDLFTRIRLRLSIKYSGMLIFMLFLFTLIVSAALFVMIWIEQTQLVQTEIDEAVAEYQDLLQHLPQGGGRVPDVQEPTGGTQVFLYVTDTKGNLVYSQERSQGLSAHILPQLNHWVPDQGNVRVMTISRVLRHGEDMLLLVSGRAIYRNGLLTGVLYTGNDVSFYWEVFKGLLKVLLILIGVFGLLAAFFGQRMAARAMVPIKSSYYKQQQFVADASHELRTPLTVLKSSIDVIELEDGDNLSEFSQTVLADMKDEVHSMSKLVADLLTLARTDSGAVELYVQTFDLADTAQHVVRLRKTLAQEKEIDLSLQASSDLMMTGDAERIKQLLVILLDNALAYTPEGGRISVSVSTENRAHVLRVSDTGMGIPLEEQERIFERFYRVEEARSRVTGGTGIGLAIAKWIVEAHRGTISVQSTPGAGSLFTAKFPVRK